MNDTFRLPLGDAIEAGIDVLTDVFRPVFDVIRFVLISIYDVVEFVLISPPFWIIIAVVAFLA